MRRLSRSIANAITKDSRCAACAGLLATPAHRTRPYSSLAQALERSNEDDHDESPGSAAAFPAEDASDIYVPQPRAAPIAFKSRAKRQLIEFPAPQLQDNKRSAKTYRVKQRTDAEVLALFVACVASGNSKRSLNLLRQIRSQMDDHSTLQAANRYLQFLVEEVPKSGSMVEARTMFDEYSTTWAVTPDAYAHALLCKAALSLSDLTTSEEQIRSIVKSWLEMQGDLGEVLSMSTVLSKKDSQKVYDVSGLDYRLIGEEYRGSVVLAEHPLQNVPEVMPTKQKGVGLKLVKHSLGALTDSKLNIKVEKDDYLMGGEQLAFNLARQRLLEENAVDAAVLRWRHEHDDLKKRGGLAYKKTLNAMFWEWKEKMVPLIEEELARVDDRPFDTNITKATSSGVTLRRYERDEQDKNISLDEQEADYQALQDNLKTALSTRARRDYGPFLGLLKPEKMAAVAILELIRCLTTESVDGLKTALLSVKVGKALENEYHSEVLKKKGSQELFQKNYRDAIQSKKMFSMSVRQARANAAKKQDTEIFTPEWTQATRARLGALMISFIMYAARVSLTVVDEQGVRHTQEAPAFYHSYHYKKGQKLGVVKANEQLTARLSSEPLKGSIYPRLLPMLAPPRPWYSWNSGGYLFTKTLAMRAKNSPEQVKYLKTASDRGLLSDVLTGLDVLGHTPWKINDRVFQCALEGWNSGESIAEIPPADSNIELPPPPAHDADPAEKFAYLEKVREASSIVRNFASMRSDINYKLEIARAFLNDTMYFPHSLDFRGRAYPVPPHFNHLGNDLCRGLLKFGVEKELGDRGLRWLKIHLANQCGFDKASFEEREAFADKNIEKIFEANDHPMDGTRWWLGTDKPWQCLATCFELTAALRSPDPTKFMSSMPVHQDGTCNGLQHYAALGGDLVGAKQVNLEPSERPQDVYRGVADIVRVEVDRDAENGDSQAKLLQGHISRKLVKQTVMTNVYGVTWVGARLQIENQLKDLVVFKEENIFSLASYVVNKVFKALKSMFTGAHEIQEWLRQSAQIITKSIHLDALVGNVQDPMTSVIWTSPLDLPIVQPYRKEVRRQIYTNLQTVFLSDPADAAEVNSKKQSSAFPPNFIHSLDATHMLMSALACRKEEVCFAAVHDSYWTHAADTDKMNVILREAFIKLHSEDLMAELESEFKKRYEQHYSPNYQFQKTSPAYLFAISQEHINAGAVRVLPKNRGIVIIDRDIANKVLKFGTKGKPGPRSHRVSGILDETTGEQAVAESQGGDSALDADPATNLDEEEQFGEDEAEDESELPEARSRRSWAVWTPIAFPKLPKKGDFDVKSLKSSKYFFS
ncbi:DNA-directed RNA polymerase [Taphrina deformans PYCC 5710]|uniref:DNA-directed RNA polymerase n=1 Tax=Taphrina deformans (strain PYCC 5710 / ATCC 11124 / CBS 356.35 / IMI 108563 / JCM 9778 / NBRC 8474) TaxID=1097556 RepID=R4XD37_TAPDE|nr:DNA-directed RNA polymerase [Taphrina deformans PYCC 5710]|eukprot:CCG81235.1 DNA-directed RNA polymerase [Taphrina deformans PYCC 5710]